MKTMKYILMAFLPLMALSCQDEWDEHYGQTNPMASQESLWQALCRIVELCTFGGECGIRILFRRRPDVHPLRSDQRLSDGS